MFDSEKSIIINGSKHSPFFFLFALIVIDKRKEEVFPDFFPYLRSATVSFFGILLRRLLYQGLES